jgi:hypothetical protein
MPTIGTGISIGGGVSISTQLGPSIGDAYGGGFYAGQISTSGNGVATHNLVISPRASGTAFNRRYLNFNIAVVNTNSVIDGPTNSAAVVALYGTNAQAAYFCETLTVGGFSDWYLPAKNELEVLYYNLKPLPTNNNTSSGINPNAIPPRASNYTTGTPSRTSATQFQAYSGTEYMIPTYYWSSTQDDRNASNYCYLQSPYTGQQIGFFSGVTKSSLQYCCAIRRVAV